jgi:hypothetical protein
MRHSTRISQICDRCLTVLTLWAVCSGSPIQEVGLFDLCAGETLLGIFCLGLLSVTASNGVFVCANREWLIFPPLGVYVCVLAGVLCVLSCKC